MRQLEKIFLLKTYILKKMRNNLVYGVKFFSDNVSHVEIRLQLFLAFFIIQQTVSFIVMLFYTIKMYFQQK